MRQYHARPARRAKASMALSTLLTLTALTALMALTGCAGPSAPASAMLGTRQGWFDGRVVVYITTDVSERDMALDMQANYVPQLRQALNRPGSAALVERVYVFPDGEQGNVFASAPTPVGSGQADASYSPLWRMVMVRRARAASPAVLLGSEEAVLAAVERGEWTLLLTEAVANCPIVRVGPARPAS